MPDSEARWSVSSSPEFLVASHLNPERPKKQYPQAALVRALVLWPVFVVLVSICGEELRRAWIKIRQPIQKSVAKTKELAAHNLEKHEGSTSEIIMTKQEALNIFGLSDELSGKKLKLSYKKLALKYHPDRNPIDTSTEKMKELNKAYAILLKCVSDVDCSLHQQVESSNSSLHAALKILKSLDDVDVEIIGNWILISGGTFKHINALISIGCRIININVVNGAQIGSSNLLLEWS